MPVIPDPNFPLFFFFSPVLPKWTKPKCLTGAGLCTWTIAMVSRHGQCPVPEFSVGFRLQMLPSDVTRQGRHNTIIITAREPIYKCRYTLNDRLIGYTYYSVLTNCLAFCLFFWSQHIRIWLKPGPTHLGIIKIEWKLDFLKLYLPITVKVRIFSSVSIHWLDESK